MSTKTAIERVATNFPVSVGANAIAAFGATVTPLAAFVPFLVQSLASSRQAKRVETMLADLDSIIQAHTVQIEALADDQYKLISEAISAAFYTIDVLKLEFLKNAVVVAIERPDIPLAAADSLSRALRDISSDEAAFIVNNFKFVKVVIDSEIAMDDPNRSDHLIVRPGTINESIVSGLISLGLLYTKSSSWDAQLYEWSPLVAKLIVLLSKPN